MPPSSRPKESSASMLAMASAVGADKQSIHIGEYYKITYSDGKISKVLDPATYRPTFKEGWPVYDKGTTYFNPQGQEVLFNPSNNLWEPK